MSPQFLNNLAGPQEYATFETLIDLWKIKASLASGHPFDPRQDVNDIMLDAMLHVALGMTTDATVTQTNFLSQLEELDGVPCDQSTAVTLPRTDSRVVYEAIIEFIQSCEIPISSPFGVMHHALALKIYPSLRRAVSITNDLVNKRLQHACAKFDHQAATEDDVKSALDLMVAREVALAKKEGREPVRNSQTLRDEAIEVLIGGFDTTASIILWGMSRSLLMHDNRLRKADMFVLV